MSSPQAGNHNILQREQPSYGVQSGTYSDGRAIQTFYAKPSSPTTVAQFPTSAYGAVYDGVTDDTAAIQAAMQAAAAAGGGQVWQLGASVISSPITSSAPNVHLVGVGRGSQLIASSGFSGAALVTLTADYCGVQNLSLIGGPSANSASNPSAKGILLSGARYATLRDLEARYLNGYTVEAAVTASVTNQGLIIDNLHAIHTAGGIHILSSAALNNIGQAWLSNLNLEIIDTLDGLLIEEANDIEVTNYGGAVAQGGATNSALHVKGASAGVLIVNPDLGVYPNTPSAPVVLIESSANGSPNRVTLVGGELNSGTYNYQATAGSNLLCSGVQFRAFTTIGASVESAAQYALFTGCEFNSTATTGTTGRYDVNVPSSSARVTLNGCMFRDAIGSAAGQVNATLNSGGGRVYVLGCDFEGATYANAFAGGKPGRVVNCANINPVGNGVTQYSVPASGTAQTNTSGVDCTVYLTGGTFTGNHQVGGVSIGNSTATVLRVAAGQTVTLTYSAAPTWVWIGD